MGTAILLRLAEDAEEGEEQAIRIDISGFVDP